MVMVMGNGDGNGNGHGHTHAEGHGHVHSDGNGDGHGHTHADLVSIRICPQEGEPNTKTCLWSVICHHNLRTKNILLFWCIYTKQQIWIWRDRWNALPTALGSVPYSSKHVNYWKNKLLLTALFDNRTGLYYLRLLHHSNTVSGHSADSLAALIPDGDKPTDNRGRSRKDWWTFAPCWGMYDYLRLIRCSHSATYVLHIPVWYWTSVGNHTYICFGLHDTRILIAGMHRNHKVKLLWYSMSCVQRKLEF